VIKKGKIEISDNFYGKYSFTNDFSHDSESEIQNIKDLLKSNGLPFDDTTTLKTLKLIREIALLVDERYPREYQEYVEWRREKKYIKGVEPFIIDLAKQILIAFIVEKVKKAFDRKRLKDEEEKEIVDKMVEQISKDKENKKIIVKIKKTYEVSKK